MARWAGWGAGPAGAGAAGPTRTFLAIALVACAIVAGVLFVQGRLAASGVAACATIYFALRLFAGLGRT
ncbi:MAG: hypothetical protein ACM3NW_05850 [Syntrophomonadaceae bacterium]